MAQPKQEGPATPADVNPYWTRNLARWEELYAKLNEGGRLTASEYEELYRLDKDLESLRKDRPEIYNKAADSLNRFDAARGGDGSAEPGGLLGDTTSSMSRTFDSRYAQRTDVNRVAQTDIQQTAVQYVDLPTADEFLDDFENAYNIHITGMVQSGAINPAAAQFARENMGQIFGEYLREQTGRLLKGEPLWRVVGANADNQLVGRRTGDQSQTDEITASETTEKLNRAEQTSSSETTSTTPSQTGPGAAVDSASGTESGTTSGTEFEDFFQRQRTKFAQDEAIVSRNKLGYVANLSPLDFFKDKLTSQRLNLLYGGYKGARTREQQTAAGQQTVQARRI